MWLSFSCIWIDQGVFLNWSFSHQYTSFCPIGAEHRVQVDFACFEVCHVCCWFSMVINEFAMNGDMNMIGIHFPGILNNMCIHDSMISRKCIDICHAVQKFYCFCASGEFSIFLWNPCVKYASSHAMAVLQMHCNTGSTSCFSYFVMVSFITG